MLVIETVLYDGNEMKICSLACGVVEERRGESNERQRRGEEEGQRKKGKGSTKKICGFPRLNFQSSHQCSNVGLVAVMMAVLNNIEVIQQQQIKITQIQMAIVPWVTLCRSTINPSVIGDYLHYY